MKSLSHRLWLPCCLWLWAVLAFAQGPLTPPGPPGPTMKTLTQIEPRTLISSVPFTITQPGSYYLTGDLTGSSGQNGIVIQSSNVTLDLNGFSIVGGLNGIEATSGNGNGTVIRNGTVRGCAGVGINLANATKCQLERLVVHNNGGDGIAAGNGSMLSLCTVAENTGRGISVADGSTVASCIVRSNAADGILVSSNCRVAENVCNQNGASAGDAGIHAAGAGNRIEGNTLSRNNGRGLRVDGTENLVIKNSAYASVVTDYDIASNNSYGQILIAPGAGFINSNPWANFSTSCPAGQSSCNGTCLNLTSNPNNCGACGNVCAIANASPTCLNGTCAVGTCNSGFADCNLSPGDGCETALNSLNNCGGCGIACSASHATPGCNAGVCTIAFCDPGFGDCDLSVANGCETGLNSIANCGGCGITCSANNATPACNGGVCAILSCQTPFANCDGQAANGCEINLNTSINNCGACGNSCFRQNATTSCNGGVCTIASCNPGFGNCDGLAANGCEVNTSNDRANCGGCGITCGTFQSCVNSVCQ